MKRISVILLLSLLFTACVEHEEISFEGVVVGTRGCSGIVFDNNPGFFVKLSTPDSIGGTLTLTSTEGETMTWTNVVVLYEPPRLIYLKDTIHGTFYLDDDYSKANCSIEWNEINVPEGVFVQVTVD